MIYNLAPFGSCKSISGKYSIFRKCYFSERKMFSCVWLHFKKCSGKYFLVFGCVLENTIENTFSTCCSHFLTFSRLPNNRNTNKHRNTNIPVKYRNTNIFWVRREAAITRDRREGEITIGAVLCTILMILADDFGGRSQRSKLWTISASSAFLVARWKLWKIFLFSWLSSFFLSLLRVTRKWFEGKMKL